MSFDSDLRTALTAAERQLPDEAAVLAGIHRAVGRRQRRRAAMSSGLVVLALAIAPLGWAVIDRAMDRPDAAPANPAPKVSTRVVTVPEYRALSPAATPCVLNEYTKAKTIELTNAVYGLLAGKAGGVTPSGVNTTCGWGTSASFGLGAGGELFAYVSYHKGSFAAHRGECKPQCGPADAIVRTSEQTLPGGSTPGVRYDVSVLRPDDRMVQVSVGPDRTGVPALSMTELIELATGQPLATHATATKSAPDLSVPIR